MESLVASLSPEIRALIASLRKDVTSSTISTTSGLNYYFLEEQAKNIYPVFYPLLASIPRTAPMQRGVKVGGPAINYKGIVAIDPGGYPGLSEGNRNSLLSVTERDFAASYKWLGKDTAVTFQAEQTGLGLDDNVGLAQLGALNALLNAEERMILWGNSGTAGNGYALGTCNTPTLADAGAVAGATLPSTTFYKVYAVALAGWGIDLATATGVQPTFSRTTANGVTETVSGGVGAISAVSNEIELTATGHGLTATVTAQTGALGYAWYLGSAAATGGETAATSYFVGITAAPTITITAQPADTNQNAAASGLSSDNSFSSLDFDGIISWIVGAAAQGTSQSPYFKNLGGTSLTSNGDGTIAQIETALQYMWQNFKIAPDYILCSIDQAQPITTAILNGGANSATRVFFNMSQTGGIQGGSFTSEYRSKFSVSGLAKPLPVRVHPWLPSGTILLYTVNNPYPAAGGSIPSVLRVVALEDHFGLRYPFTTLEYSMGVYCFETLQNYIPFAHALLCGIGSASN